MFPKMPIFKSSLLVLSACLLLLTQSVSADVGGSPSPSPWENAPEHVQKSMNLIDEERFDAAIDELNQVLGNHPDDADVLNLLGFSHRSQGAYDKALEYYVAALTSDPAHKGAMEYLGELYLQTNQLEKAEMQLEALSDVCTFCKERKMLRKAIRKYKSKNS